MLSTAIIYVMTVENEHEIFCWKFCKNKNELFLSDEICAPFNNSKWFTIAMSVLWKRIDSFLKQTKYQQVS